MVSWGDAFLILKKWRDESTLLEYSEVIPWESPQGETIAMARGGWSARVAEVSPGGVKILLEDSRETRDWELIGASFEYMDSRESPFLESPTSSLVCALEIEFSDGRLIVLADKSGEPG